MKKLNEKDMLRIEGGLPCIVHGLAMSLGVFSVFFNGGEVIQCWKNTHLE